MWLYGVTSGYHASEIIVPGQRRIVRNLSQAPTFLSSPHARLLACIDVGTAIVVSIYCRNGPFVPCQSLRGPAQLCTTLLVSMPDRATKAHVLRRCCEADPTCSALLATVAQHLPNCQIALRIRPCASVRAPMSCLSACMPAHERSMHVICRVVAVRTVPRPPASCKAADARRML